MKKQTFKVIGFKRDEPGIKVTMIVDANPEAFVRGDGTAHDVAEALAPDYCFQLSQSIDCVVPDAAKNRLFFSNEELYAAAPEMNPKRPVRVGKYVFHH